MRETRSYPVASQPFIATISVHSGHQTVQFPAGTEINANSANNSLEQALIYLNEATKTVLSLLQQTQPTKSVTCCGNCKRSL